MAILLVELMGLANSEQFKGELDADSVTLDYLIETDGNDQTYTWEVYDACVTAGLLPAPGELLLNTPYAARDVTCEWSGDFNRVLFFASVTYDNRPIDQEDWPTPDRYDPQEPENDLPIITVGTGATVNRDDVIDFRGALCINSAGDVLDPMPQMEFTPKSYSIEVNRRSPIDYSFLGGSTNSGPVEILGDQWEAFTGTFSSFSVSGPHVRWYKPTGQPGPGTRIVYYTHRITLEFLQAPKPSTVILLDPSNILPPAAGVPASMQPFNNPRDSQPVTYIPAGTVSANVGLNAWLLPPDYNEQYRWASGESCFYNGDAYKALVDNGPDTKADVQSPPDAANANAYWERLPDDINVGYLVKRRIRQQDLVGTVNGEKQLVSDDIRNEPVDTPQYLTPDGKLIWPYGAGDQVWGIVNMTKDPKDWTVVNGINSWS